MKNRAGVLSITEAVMKPSNSNLTPFANNITLRNSLMP